MKKRVFVSFDFDNDKRLKDFIIGQSRLPVSPFEVIDNSLKEAAPERDWETKANAAIKRSEVVIVMVGPPTHRAQGVLRDQNGSCGWAKDCAGDRIQRRKLHPSSRRRSTLSLELGKSEKDSSMSKGSSWQHKQKKSS